MQYHSYLNIQGDKASRVVSKFSKSKWKKTKRNGNAFNHLSLTCQAMYIFDINIPHKPLTNIELSTYARELRIPHFRGVFMRYTLPHSTLYGYCGIVNLDTSNQADSHRVCCYRNKNDRIYFDSYGQITHVEIQRYLKTGREFDHGKEVIQRNTDIIQAANTSVYGHICLFVLKSLANGEQFQTVLNHRKHYGGYP